MHKIDAVIIDDEPKNVQILAHFIIKYCPMVQIVGEAYSKTEGIKLIDKLKPQLVYLDIELNDGNGFEVLENITYTQIKVIFVTSFNKYAIKAFKYNAVDYILKPIDIEELTLATSKVYHDIQNNLFFSSKQINMMTKSLGTKEKLEFVALPSTNKIDFIKVNDIICLKSEGRYTVFSLVGQKDIMTSKNLGEYESFLDSEVFFRVHNSYIVNLKNIVQIDRTGGNYCRMIDNQLIPLAKRRMIHLQQFLGIK